VVWIENRSRPQVRAEKAELVALKERRRERQRAEVLLEEARELTAARGEELERLRAAHRHHRSPPSAAPSISGSGTRGVATVTAAPEDILAAADAVALWRAHIHAGGVALPDSMVLDEDDLDTIFGSGANSDGGTLYRAGRASRDGFFAALAGQDRCISRADFLALASRVRPSEVELLALFVAAADGDVDLEVARAAETQQQQQQQQQQGVVSGGRVGGDRLGPDELASALRLYAHYFRTHVPCVVDFHTAVLEPLALHIAGGDDDAVAADSKAVVEEVMLTVVGVEHLPPSADGDFDACVYAYQRDYFHPPAGGSGPGAGAGGGGGRGRWGLSEKKLGCTNVVQAFPGAEEPTVGALVGFEALEASFSCVAPGEVRLELHDENWLHANLDGAVRLELRGGGGGVAELQRFVLRRGGRPVMGCAGQPTTLVVSVQPMATANAVGVGPSPPTAAAAAAAAPPSVMDVAAWPGRSESAEALAAVADTVSLYQAVCAQRQCCPPSMSLSSQEFAVLDAEIVPPDGEHPSISTPWLLAYLRRDALGKHVDRPANQHVLALLLAFTEAPEGVFGPRELRAFVRLYKHYIHTYSGTGAEFCEEVLSKLAHHCRQRAAPTAAELQKVAGGGGGGGGGGGDVGGGGVHARTLTVAGVEHLPSTVDGAVPQHRKGPTPAPLCALQRIVNALWRARRL
jgi:hypothetical protein